MKKINTFFWIKIAIALALAIGIPAVGIAEEVYMRGAFDGVAEDCEEIVALIERGDADGARSAPHVSEEEYAKFLCRYVLLAVASGHVSRVYWWRLVHRGFGLVDDADASNPRRRPAFESLKTLFAQLAGARFERRLADVPAGTFALEFSREDGSRFVMRWTRETFPKLEEIRSKNG